MKVSSFFWPLATILLTTASLTQAQQPLGKVVRMGYLGIDRSPASMPREKAFLQGLRDHGWIEGQNILIERRYWENRAQRLPVLADEMVRLNVDIIVTTSGTAALTAKQATSTTPIIMTSSADAVSQGLVASLAYRGGNVTGLTNISNDLAGKQLELLKESFPRISRVTALGCPASGGAVGDRRSIETKAAAQDLKIQLQTVMVNSPEEVENALRAANRERAEALFVHDCSVIPATKTVALIAHKAPGDIPYKPVCGSRRPYDVRPEWDRFIPAGCDLRGQNSERHETCRASCGATKEH